MAKKVNLSIPELQYLIHLAILDDDTISRANKLQYYTTYIKENNIDFPPNERLMRCMNSKIKTHNLINDSIQQDIQAVKELDDLKLTFKDQLLEISGIGEKTAITLSRYQSIDKIPESKMTAETVAFIKYKPCLEIPHAFAIKVAEKILDRKLTQSNISKPKLVNDEGSFLAGSLRRRKKFVKDIDLLYVGHTIEEILQKIRSLGHDIVVYMQGEHKASFIFLDKINVKVDVIVSKPKEFIFALIYFTGSTQHNIKMRMHIKRFDKYDTKRYGRTFNTTLNQYGLFDNGKIKYWFPVSELDFYRHIRMDYVPPHLR